MSRRVRERGDKPNEHPLRYCYEDKMKTTQLKSQQIGFGQIGLEPIGGAQMGFNKYLLPEQRMCLAGDVQA